MDNRIIIAQEEDREAILEDLTAESLARTMRFLFDDKSPAKELLEDLIDEDFVRPR